jgi:hypothetical protein
MPSIKLSCQKSSKNLEVTIMNFFTCLKSCLPYTILLLLSGQSAAQVCVTKPLQFGFLVPGQTSSVDKYSSNAMCLTRERIVTGTYRVTISLPTTLANGASNLPVTFAPDDAVYWYFRGTWIGPIEHNPAASFTTQNSTRDIVLRLGSTVSVPIGAQAGLYTGQIVVTLLRTGS